MSDDVVRTVGLRKVYADFWGRPRVTALEGLDLEIQRGEVFGLLGPNGSGKTTTIKLLLGLIRASKGDAFVLGRDPGDLAVRRRVGYLPEETYLWRFLDANETLAFVGRLFDLPAAESARRADALLNQVGLGQARGRRVGEYSKGMARRLGLAQALINDPELVILDEPTSGLDPVGSAEVKDLILNLKKAGKTVLLSSHLLADVEDVCDRIAILHQGRLAESGRVDTLLADDRRLMVELAAPDAATIEAVKAAAGSSLLGIAPPRERLEQRFRRIVTGTKQESGDRQA
ncbi:MAG: ABC transporter ATP-binding protein [Planctomycetota bacterium]